MVELQYLQSRIHCNEYTAHGAPPVNELDAECRNHDRAYGSWDEFRHSDIKSGAKRVQAKRFCCGNIYDTSKPKILGI